MTRGDKLLVAWALLILVGALLAVEEVQALKSIAFAIVFLGAVVLRVFDR